MTYSKYTTKIGGKERTPFRDSEQLHGSVPIEQRMAATQRRRREQLTHDFDDHVASIDRKEDRVTWLIGQWFNQTYNLTPNRIDSRLDNQVNTHPNAREQFKTIIKRHINELIFMLQHLLNRFRPEFIQLGYTTNMIPIDVDTTNEDIKYYQDFLVQVDEEDLQDPHTGDQSTSNCIGNECTTSGGRKRKSKKTKTSKKTRTSKKTKKTKKTRRVKKTNTRSK
tara:strand:+ start:1609 stop:2277 length:669 start_codon:yes stop_codon:yes gene_type:complete